MQISIETNEFTAGDPVRIGNVYAVKGGRGIREKHMQILIAITNDNLCLFLQVNKDGDPVGVNKYGLHYVEDMQPIAFVEGLEELTLVMRSL